MAFGVRIGPQGQAERRKANAERLSPHTYGYSPLSQLTTDQRSSGGTTSWTPDGASQVTQRVDPTGPATSTLSYDAASELGSLRTVSGTTTTRNLTLSYNADGDRTSQSDSVSGSRSSYGYDQEDRPITATSGLTQSSYAYDGDGLRQSKTVSGTTTAETWDTAAGLPQLVQDGSTRYVPGPDGSPLEQIASDGTVLYYYQDQLGSTRSLLNGTGQTVATYSYDPYGQLSASTGSVRTPFGFAGQYTDAETGLQYLRARSYDPATMQFMSVDPLEDQTGQPYAYAAANPLNLGDPTGLQCNGAQGQGWARFGSSFGDLGCNIGELKDWVLTHRNNGTTTGTVVEVSSFIFGPVTVAGAPSSACDPAYEGQVAQDQQALNTEASNANWFVGLTLGGAGAVRGVAGLVGGLRGAAAETAGSAGATGTVWDSIVATQPVYEGTVIPRSFELATAHGRFWVHGNATKHLDEYAAGLIRRLYSPATVRMATQAQLTSLQAAVDAAASEGIVYGRMMQVVDWELIFAPPRVPGQLPAIIHALMH